MKNTDNLKKLYDRFIWETGSSALYMKAMQESDCMHMLNTFMLTRYEPDGTDLAVSDFTSIFKAVGHKC